MHRFVLGVCVMAAAGSAASASTFDTRSGWETSLNGGVLVVDDFGGSGQAWNPTRGRYGQTGTLSGYAGNGPSDSEAQNWVASSYSRPLDPNASPRWTITSANNNPANNALSAFFILDNPNDANNVDNVGNGEFKGPGAENDVASDNNYLSFYNSGTVLTIDLQPDSFFNSFGFDSLDLKEGRIRITWGNGVTDTITTGGSSSPFQEFFGVTRYDTTIDFITIESLNSQGIAIDNLSFARAVPLPSTVGLGVAGLGMVAVRRRR